MTKISGLMMRRPGWTRAASLLFTALLFAAAMTAKAPAQEADKKIPNEQLEQLVAPIALYPDSLLAQTLMASTYPLEIVQADRWAKGNPKLTGKALEDKLVSQPWDASVKSIVAVPQVLTMMSEKLDWTQKLGDAFLAQQEDVLSAVQRLRAKAEGAGTLTTTPEQKVSKQTVANKTVVVIEPTNPEVVYVPAYNPMVAYGAWPYPAYPPYAWYPPGYAAGRLLSFGLGVAVGGALWGNCNWGAGNVNINVNRYNNFNRTNISNGNWNHNAAHRKGVPYSNKGVAERNGRGAGNTAAREQFRGRADSGNLGLGNQGANRPQQRDASAGNRDKAGSRDKPAGARQQPSNANRAGTRDNRNSQAFNGVGNGADVRRQSDRGNASRQSSQMQHRAASRPSGGGVSRGGGGGGRGGGGGGRGGGRR